MLHAMRGSGLVVLTALIACRAVAPRDDAATRTEVEEEGSCAAWVQSCRDGVLYGNGCPAGPDVVLGTCVDESVATGVVTSGCAADFSPVCGRDGRSYDHACEAEKAGVEVSSDGACGAVTDTASSEETATEGVLDTATGTHR